MGSKTKRISSTFLSYRNRSSYLLTPQGTWWLLWFCSGLFVLVSPSVRPSVSGPLTHSRVCSSFISSLAVLLYASSVRCTNQERRIAALGACVGSYDSNLELQHCSAMAISVGKETCTFEVRKALRWTKLEAITAFAYVKALSPTGTSCSTDVSTNSGQCSLRARAGVRLILGRVFVFAQPWRFAFVWQ